MQRETLLALGAAQLRLLSLLPATALAVPTCADLATHPAWGLAGNPVISAATSALVPATMTNAAYCNVQITYSALSGPPAGYDVGQDQVIRIGIGLPLNSADDGSGGVEGAWNGKLENLGGSGCAGNVGATTGATNAGYVGTSTDTGHASTENGQRCNFGVIQSDHALNLGRIEDFIYEGVHQQVEWGKALARSYYRTDATRNYWNGCSTGGRQGLALAQTHGAEFDGFVIGAPAIYWQQFRLSDAWPALVIKDDLIAKGKTLTAAQFDAANMNAIAACDVQGADVVSDGIIDDPRACTFSAAANICGKPLAPRRRRASMPIRRRRSTGSGTGRAIIRAGASGIPSIAALRPAASSASRGRFPAAPRKSWRTTTATSTAT